MDTSVFNGIKSEVLLELQSCEKIEKLDCVLFLVNNEVHLKLLEYSKRLEIEYSYDKDVLKRYSLGAIVKHLNEDGPTHTYSLNEKTFAKQINDQEKVRDSLDGEFAIWKNSLLKQVTSKVASMGLKGAALEEKIKELHKEADEAEEVLEYIKEHFDELDVKISSLLTRPSLGVIIRFRLSSSAKEKSIRLKNSIPNVLYIKEKEQTIYPNNKLTAYLKSATHAFGDVYYKLKSSAE
jgi:hypothetical protein